MFAGVGERTREVTDLFYILTASGGNASSRIGARGVSTCRARNARTHGKPIRVRIGEALQGLNINDFLCTTIQIDIAKRRPSRVKERDASRVQMASRTQDVRVCENRGCELEQCLCRKLVEWIGCGAGRSCREARWSANEGRARQPHPESPTGRQVEAWQEFE